jgi:hypothetical protein
VSDFCVRDEKVGTDADGESVSEAWAEAFSQEDQGAGVALRA